MKFTEFGLDNSLLDGINSIGFDDATPIQNEAIPAILAGKDLIASAQTGTGKTAAFLLPLINKIITQEQDGAIKAMVIVPTRELAMQIDQNLEGLSYFTPVSSMAVYGGGDGQSFERERRALTTGVDMVICTPGRMIAHLNMGHAKVEGLKYLVLDEADRMLDMGFVDDIIKIISFLPQQRQNLLFSATMPSKIRELAKKILQNPVEINLAVSTPPEKILQVAYVVYDRQKLPILKSLLNGKDIKSALIFCSTKSNTKILGRELKRLGLQAEEIHSDLEQLQREKVMLDFKNRKLSMLVATDILSRGIDVEDIELVINFDVPNDGEDYIHRIGRTARAESDGVAITFVGESEHQKFGAIEQLLGKEVYKAKILPEFGDAPEYNPGKSKRNDDNRNRFRKKSHEQKGNHEQKNDNKKSGDKPQKKFWKHKKKPNQ